MSRFSPEELELLAKAISSAESDSEAGFFQRLATARAVQGCASRAVDVDFSQLRVVTTAKDAAASLPSLPNVLLGPLKVRAAALLLRAPLQISCRQRRNLRRQSSATCTHRVELYGLNKRVLMQGLFRRQEKQSLTILNGLSGSLRAVRWPGACLSSKLLYCKRHILRSCAHSMLPGQIDDHHVGMRSASAVRHIAR